MTLFYTKYNDKSYQYSNEDDTGDLYVPLNVDTEFYNRSLDDTLLAVNPSQTITVQVRGIEKDDKGKIYTHLDSCDIARHDLFTDKFIGFQYLKDNGYELEYTRPQYITLKDKSLPKIHFHLYLHFACADLIRLFYDDYQQDIRDLILSAKGSGNNQGITQQRRLQTYNRYGRYKPYCNLNWFVSLNGQTYQVVLTVYDTIAIAGNQSYSNLAKLVGFDLPYKDTLTLKDKRSMNDTYINNSNFDNYALGDLYAYELLLAFDERVKHLQQVSMDNNDNILNTRLTIGSTIASIFEQQIRLKLPTGKHFKELTKNSNSDYLRKVKDTRAILSKVDGGRCYNNRPLDTIVTKNGDYENLDDLVGNQDLLCDVDISGAYGKGLCLQDYPIGKPKCFNHLLDKNNKYYTLREFLKKHENELVDGLWIMRVSSLKPLKYPQDLISSWVVDETKIDRLSDSENDDISVDYPKIGYTKIFTNQINLGLINSDTLQWIDNICSQSQRKELYDNLVVVNAMWYDKNKELDSIDKVVEKLENFDDGDTCFYDGDKRVSMQNDCYYWTRLNIGDLFIKKLLQTRNKYPKKQYPNENNFYKLAINTTYGVLVSKFFSISNTVVGNNITARCRCMMWYLEKGLNGFQSITDGCIFELDNVTYPVNNKRLTANNLVKGYQKTVRDRKWKTDKLTINKYWKGSKEGIKYSIKYGEESKDFIKLVEDDYKENVKTENGKLIFKEKYLKKLINIMTNVGKLDSVKYDIENDILEHLRSIFPNVDVLHKKIINQDGLEQIGYYTLEIKCLAKKAIFHANADYYLEDTFEIKENKLSPSSNHIKMRGYKKDNTFSFEDDNDLDYLENDEITLEEMLFSDSDTKTGKLEELVLNDVNVPEKLFKCLNDDLNAIERTNYFITNKIIKCKDFKQNQKTYKHTNLEIGYNYPQAKLMTELVLSQFTYPDIETFESWKDKHYKHKQKYGQGYESCFLNDDNTLRYQDMIETIDEKIKTGKTLRLKKIEHPYYSSYENRKTDILNRHLI